MREMSDMEFRKNFRLSRAAFLKLQERIDPGVRREETFAGNTVSVERRLALPLYFLGQGTNYRTLANQFGVDISTACQIVKETARAIQDTHMSELIKFPTSDAELHAAMQTFNFPNCVGAIDGTHIKTRLRDRHMGPTSTIAKGTIQSSCKVFATATASSPA